MEQQYFHGTNGQAIYETDTNLVATEAALADDRTLAELLRMLPFGATASRGVMPYRVNAYEAPAAQGQAIVKPGTGKVTVSPFRAFIGSRTAVGAGGKANWRDIRSAIMVGATTLDSDVTPDATLAGVQRIDLVYAAVSVDVNDAGVSRKVKSPTTGAITTSTVVVTKSTNVALGIAKGADNVATVPALPADGGGTYYIALAYVHIPALFGGATVLTNADVWEASPAITLAESTGAASIRPADGSFLASGAVEANTSFAFTGRKAGHLPSTLVGGEEILVALDLVAPNFSHVTGDVVDASRDWTKRLWTWQIAGIGSGSTPFFPWESAAATPLVPGSTCLAGSGLLASGMGQSFVEDLAAGMCGVAHLTPTELTGMNGGSTIDLYVDSATGELKVDYAGAPAVRLFVWLRATAQFGNPG